MRVIHKEGKKPIKFHEGGLHESLGIAKNKKIPKSRLRAALSGKEGPKAEKQAQFMKNVLVGHG
jgi:hypothetical protein